MVPLRLCKVKFGNEFVVSDVKLLSGALLRGSFKHGPQSLAMAASFMSHLNISQ
jgi:hypothetical protein